MCQAFRRDLYVKGRAPLWTAERTRRVEQVRLVASPFNRLPSPESQGNKDRIGVDIGIGRVQMDRGRCMEVLHHVGTAGLTVGELHRALAKGALPDTVQLVTMMLFSGWLTLHKDTAAGAASLNRAIIRAVCSGAPYRHLAVPSHDEAALLDGVKALIALACIECNRFKGSDLASVDPETSLVERIFDPRAEAWDDHFRASDGVIDPLTARARATVALLRMNAPPRVEVRAALSWIGRWPRSGSAR